MATPDNLEKIKGRFTPETAWLVAAALKSREAVPQKSLPVAAGESPFLHPLDQTPLSDLEKSLMAPLVLRR